MTADPWEVRRVASGLALELHGGDVLAFLLAHGDPAIRADLATLRGWCGDVSNRGIRMREETPWL